MTVRATAGVAAALAPAMLLGLGSCTLREAPAREFRLEEATVADINAAFDAGALTCRGLVELYLRRIAAYDSAGPGLNSMITLNPRALEIAAALDDERMATGPRSVLHCIPVVLKDNIDTGDMPTSNGSVILKDAVAPDDAFITRRLRGAGALVLGKASLGEFAGGNSYNSVDGQTVNAYHRLRAAGGSSSGSAVAVAANLATLGVGTDTSQSVRIPAAFNGLAALRPTTGLVSRDGIAPKNLNFDTAGPMARTVTDLAILLTAIAGPDPADPDGLSQRVFGDHPAGPSAAELDYTRFLERGALEGARLGIARDYFGGDPQIDALAEEAIAAMRELGAEVVDPVTFDGSFVDGVRAVADYRFRADWEAYLAPFGGRGPEHRRRVPRNLPVRGRRIRASRRGNGSRSPRACEHQIDGGPRIHRSARKPPSAKHRTQDRPVRRVRPGCSRVSDERELRAPHRKPGPERVGPDVRGRRSEEPPDARRLQFHRVSGRRRADGSRLRGGSP